MVLVSWDGKSVEITSVICVIGNKLSVQDKVGGTTYAVAYSGVEKN